MHVMLYSALSDSLDILGLVTLLSFRNGKLDLFAFLEVSKAVTSNGGVMDKHIGGAITFDKAISLIVAEPLHSSRNSLHIPSSPKLYCSPRHTILSVFIPLVFAYPRLSAAKFSMP